MTAKVQLTNVIDYLFVLTIIIKSNDHRFKADWLHSKRDALSNNRKVDGSSLTGSTQACHS